MRYFKHITSHAIYRVNSDDTVELFFRSQGWIGSSFRKKELLAASKTLNCTKLNAIIKNYQLIEITEQDAFIELL